MPVVALATRGELLGCRSQWLHCVDSVGVSTGGLAA